MHASINEASVLILPDNFNSKYMLNELSIDLSAFFDRPAILKIFENLIAQQFYHFYILDADVNLKELLITCFSWHPQVHFTYLSSIENSDLLSLKNNSKDSVLLWHQGTCSTNAIDSFKIENYIRFTKTAGSDDIRLQVLSSRNFNQIYLKPFARRIEKFSQQNAPKLANETYWMSQLPPACQNLIPRVLDFSSEKSKPFLALEYVAYPTLASSFLFSQQSAQNIQNALKKILHSAHDLLWKNTKLNADAGSLFYSQVFTKLEKRLQQYPQHIDVHQTYTLSSQKLFPLDYYLHKIKEEVTTYSQNLSELCTMHGDLCFSNILYEFATNDFKFIDPLGSFGNAEPSLYGHSIYDLAKLRQSISGNYDSYAFNYFYLNSNSANQFELKCLKNKFQNEVTDYFDAQIEAMNANLRIVKIVEACLFLSMVPLHSENSQRQMAMYLTGLKKAHDLFG